MRVMIKVKVKPKVKAEDVELAALSLTSPST